MSFQSALDYAAIAVAFVLIALLVSIRIDYGRRRKARRMRYRRAKRPRADHMLAADSNVFDVWDEPSESDQADETLKGRTEITRTN